MTEQRTRWTGPSLMTPKAAGHSLVVWTNRLPARYPTLSVEQCAAIHAVDPTAIIHLDGRKLTVRCSCAPPYDVHAPHPL